jgi:DNA-binding response OmpR family regulator
MKQKILVIDDEINIAETIADLLELQGYEVKVASDGESGFFVALRENPDLILCDVMMPKMDGYDVLEAVRECEEIKQTPFVFLTAKGNPQDFRDGMNLGADDYLTKPVEHSELASVVAKRLTKYQDLVELGLTLEKKRLGQDLHDTLQQTLLGLKMKVDHLVGKYPEIGELEDCVATVKTSISQLRLILDGRMSDPQDVATFSERLHMMIEKLQGYVKFKLELIDEWKTTFPNEKSAELFKVLYEVFNNEIKHSNAERVMLKLYETSTAFNIKVQDDGIGIDSGTFREGRGFKSMRERMSVIDGEIDFDTERPGLIINIKVRK